jgi:hypothetical protein
MIMRASQTNTSLVYRDNSGGAPMSARHSQTKSPPQTPETAASMYYFNIRSDRALKEDPEGSILPDLKAALEEALARARHSLTEGHRNGHDRQGWRIEIMDHAHQHLMTVAFTEAYLCEWPRRTKTRTEDVQSSWPMDRRAGP